MPPFLPFPRPYLLVSYTNIMAPLAVSRSTSARPVRAASARTSSRRSIRAVAAYKPEESKYFDIADMENTTGAWNLYGQGEFMWFVEFGWFGFGCVVLCAGAGVDEDPSVDSAVSIGGE